MVLLWQIKDDLPNSPNYLPAKLSHYMVVHGGIYVTLQITDTGFQELDNSSSGIGHFNSGATFQNVMSLVKNGSVDMVMHLGELLCQYFDNHFSDTHSLLFSMECHTLYIA